MIMNQVVRVDYNPEGMESPDCTGGNYPTFDAYCEDGTVVRGITCRCGAGCSGTNRLPKVGDVLDEDYQYVGRLLFSIEV